MIEETKKTENSNEYENVIFIGKKPLKTYLFSVTTQATREKLIRIKARGQNINKAVDVSEISIAKFINDWHKKSVEIWTETRNIEESNTEQRVSVIEIQLEKNE